MAPPPPKKRRYPFKRNLSRKFRRIFFMVIAAVIASGINYYNNHQTKNNVSIIHFNSNDFTKEQQKLAISKIQKAKNNNAQFWVGFNGKIVQNLKDDNKGSRHQKFLVSPSPDITLLVAHNIDLASRIPLKVGDSISLYGRYEWNHRGGVIHWTHHDPKGKKKGGWIKAHGKVYR